MHRQSLGSPASKLHIHGVVVAAKDDNNNSLTVEHQNEEHKSQKPQKSISRSLIHLIPIVTLLCFLILYLSSHDPSRKDLAQFSLLTLSSKPLDSTDIDDFGRILEIGKDDVLAIRSMRNLQEIDKRHLHRKIRHL